MAAQPDAELVAAMAAYQAQMVNLRANLTAYVQRLWRSLGSWRRPDISTFVSQLVPVIAGAQRQTVALTVANLARQRQLDLRTAFAPVAVNPVKVTGAAVRNGTDPREVYERPFHLVWRQLDELPREAGSIDQAIAAGMDRAVQSAMTDVQLAKTHTAHTIGQQDTKVRWMVRVLEGTQSCGLCIVASTQTYHNRNRLHPVLLPIHPGCDCSVRYAYGDDYPGLINDFDKLVDVHDRIAERFGQASSAARGIPNARDARGRAIKYRDVLISHEHGELGPILSVKGAGFTGPTDI